MSESEITRMQLLTALGDLSRLRPEWRVGQLTANIAMTAGRMDSGGVWEVEDEEALAATKTLIDQCSTATHEVTAGADAPGGTRH